MRLSKHPDLNKWIDELPSPLAVPLERVRATQLRMRQSHSRTPENEQTALLAGIDAFTAALRFMSYVCIADVLNKVHERDPFVRDRPRLERIYAAIAEVLKPRRSYGHWIACLRTIVQAYERAPESFYIPEFMSAQKKSKEDPFAFQEKLDELVQQRNQFAHGENLNLKGAELRDRWTRIDETLGLLYAQLACLTDYEMIVFYDQPEQQDHGWYRVENVYRLKGPNIATESSLILSSGTRLRSPVQRPEMDKLYLLSPNHERSLNLFPFILFQQQGELVGKPQVSTFLFNELTDKELTYHGSSPETRFECTTEQINTDEESIAGPLYSYFTGLRVALGSMEPEELERLPGWGARSNTLNFQRTIRFHANAFIGRQQHLEKVDAAMASPSFKCVWVRGKPGYGKTAFLSRLAAINQEFIPYFISIEKETANAVTFLGHLCQSMINLFNFPDRITEEHRNDLQKFADLFRDLLRRSGERLSDGKRLVFLIDALDESERYATEDEQKISRFLPRSKDEIPDGVFLVISSRPDLDMGALPDVIIDLEPFTENEIITILNRHGWDREQAVTAFRKTAGSPLYFRFLLDGVRCGEFTADGVEQLPEGVDQYYRHVWNGWTQLGQQSKRHPETAALALMQQDILGLLAAARRPLGIKELTILLSRLGHRADIMTVRHKALAKENVAKFLIGVNEFSLFHDTLREFVLDRTRPTDDDAPYGAGLRYHKALSDPDWLADAASEDYARLFQTYHLLHSRQYLRLLDLVLDDSEEGLFRTRITEEDGVNLLLTDLAHAIEAAKVLGDSGKLFCLSTLRVLLHRLGAALVFPEAVRVLFTIHKTEEVERMLNAASDDGTRMEILAAACAASLESGPAAAVERWVRELKKTANAGRFRLSTNFLKELFPFLREPTVVLLHRAVALFPETDDDDKVRALCDAVADPETVAAVFARLDVRSEAVESAGDELWQTAAKLLAAGKHDETVQFIGSLPIMPRKAWPLVPLFLRKCPAETILGKIQFRQGRFSRSLQGFDDVQELLFLLRLLSSELNLEQVDDWLLNQPGHVSLLETCRRAAELDPAWRVQGEKQLLDEGSGVSPLVNLSCIVFLALASEDEQSVWHAMLAAVIDKVMSAGIAFQGFNDMDMEEAIKPLLPTTAEIMHQVGDFFPDRQSALWFALAAASPALETMATSEIQNWIVKRLEHSGAHAVGETHAPLLEDLSRRLLEDLDTDRDDLQKLLLPLLVPFAPDPKAVERIDSLLPLEGLVQEETLVVLHPNMPLRVLGSVYPHLVDDDGDLVDLAEMLDPLLIARLMHSPENARETWDEFCRFYTEYNEMKPLPELSARVDQFSNKEEIEDDEDDEDTDLAGLLAQLEGEDDEDDDSDRPVALPAGMASLLLQVKGQPRVAWEILRDGDSFRGEAMYWLLFPFLSGDLLPQFLDHLVSEAEQGVGADVAQAVLQSVEPKQRRTGLETVMNSPSTNRYLKNGLVRMALRDGLEEAVVTYLREGDQAEYRPCLHWIDHVSQRSVTAAEGMWTELTRFARAGGAEVLDELSESLDRKLRERLTETGLQEKGKALDVLRKISSRFSNTRTSLIAAMLRQGWDQDGLEPLMVFTALDQLRQLHVAVRGNALPDWCEPVLYRCFRDLLPRPAADSSLSDLEQATVLLFAPLWTAPHREEARDLVRQALTAVEQTIEEDHDNALCRELMHLAGAVDPDSVSGMGVAATENNSRLPSLISAVAGVNPKGAWELLSSIPNPDIRNGLSDEFIAPGLSVDVQWTVATLTPSITVENTGKFLRGLLDYAEADQWPVVATMARRALDSLPKREARWFNEEQRAALIRCAPEMGADLLFKDPTEPLEWADFLNDRIEPGDCAELFAGLVPVARDRFLSGIATLTNTIAVDKWDFERAAEKVFDVLAHIRSSEIHSEHEKDVEALYQALLESLRKRDNVDLTGDVIEELAKRDPDRALAWLDDLNYTGDELDDVLSTILTKAPQHFERLFRTRLQGLGEFDRERVLSKALAHQPLETAFLYFTQYEMDADDFVEERLKVQKTDPATFDRLMSMLKDSLSGSLAAKHIKYVCAALANPLNDDSEVRERWLADVLDAVQSGRFVPARIGDDMDFGLEGETFHMFSDDFLSLLYGIVPERMDDWFRKVAANTEPEHAGRLDRTLNHIRRDSVPHLLRWSTNWVFDHLFELMRQPWWSDTSMEDISDVLEKLSTYKAVQLAATITPGFKLMDVIDKLLQSVDTAEEMQQIFMVLITDILQQHGEKAAEIIDACLKHGDRVGLPVVDIMLDWIGQFKTVDKLLNLEFKTWREVVAVMHDIADGRSLKSGEAGEGRITPETPQQADLKEQIAEKSMWISKLLEMNAPPETISLLRGQLDQLEQELAAQNTDAPE